jgi:SAM-dependent methyltransferase
MDTKEKRRKAVAEAYSQAVKKPEGAGGSCCSSGPVPKAVAAMLAGYTSEELQALPKDAVRNSFGCGNPLAFSEVREGEIVLDLGSGAGIDLLLAGKKVGPKGRAIGIDMTEEMLVRARENIQASGLTNVEVRKGIIEEMPVASNSVDWVISNCVINLSPEKPKVFNEIARVLKPGGKMSVSDIVAEELPPEIRKSSWLYNSCIAGAISEGEYIEGLKAAGLVDIEVRERLVYDQPMLSVFVNSELGCCGQEAPNEPQDKILKLLESIVGKIWSAKFFARKPR